MRTRLPNCCSWTARWNRAFADGADVAEGLREDEVRGAAAKEGEVDLVGGAAAGEVAADVVVDLGRGAAADGDGGAGEDGERGGGGGEVAFVGDSDDLRTAAKGESDLGGAEEQGGDAHWSSGGSSQRGGPGAG